MLSITQMKQLAGETIYTEGRILYTHGSVQEDRLDQKALRYTVTDEGIIYRVTIDGIHKPGCTCQGQNQYGLCRHVIAAALKAQTSGTLNELTHHIAMNSGPELFEILHPQLPDEGTIHMEVILQAAEEQDGSVPRLRVSLRVGEDRLYVVRSIPQLLQCVDRNESLDFGKGFLFEPSWMHFGRTGEQVLRVLRTAVECQQIAECEPKGPEAKSLMLPDTLTEELFSALSGMPFQLNMHKKAYEIRRVQKARIPIVIKASGSLRGLSLHVVYPKDFLPLTRSGAYAFAGGNVIEVETSQRQLMMKLWKNGYHGRATFEYPPAETVHVVDELIPYLRQLATVEITEELERLLIHEMLDAQLYLDRDGRDVVVHAVFRYGDREIDPFAPQDVPKTFVPGQRLLLRDSDKERQIMDTLAAAGFYIMRKKVVLSGQDAIYRLITEAVPKLQGLCEVFMSRDFKKMKPRKPSVQGRLSFRDGKLLLSLEGLKVSSADLSGVIEALARKKKYFRLKDGTFLDLNAMDEWYEAAEAIYDSTGQEKLTVQGNDLILSQYKTMYLSRLLDMASLPIIQDESIRKAVRDITKPEPVSPEAGLTVELRPYQKRGYAWLRSLDRLQMGGILADDMGLGKTLQMIALLNQYAGTGELSLVVAPTSLTYNWMNEIHRFAPKLRTVVVSGATNIRAQFFQKLREKNDYDVIITSYPLIRRDITDMQELDFHFVVLDEAQQIKNAFSSGASAVKQLKAKTRFALTGTPMENHAGELWSIFDFCLPGYLGSQSLFLQRYQYGDNGEELQRKISPFLMRRLKKDVLTELPDKIEYEIMAEMTPEQAKVYQASLLRARERMDRALANGGQLRGRMDILASITELRQVCCHPILAMEGYSGSSGKLDLLMDILPQRIGEGRRLLIFSQFTSMLEIIMKQLQVNGYQCLYLNGNTPSQERMELCNRFNEGEGQVFLISLRAGGTGLNLTGADTVIHFDPWWNPAVEDQATDRAHRIGQTRKVEVIRLITRQSIEEQVIQLSKNKRELFEQLISPGEHALSSLSEADIRSLFS